MDLGMSQNGGSFVSCALARSQVKRQHENHANILPGGLSISKSLRNPWLFGFGAGIIRGIVLMMFELSSHRNLIEWYSSIRDNAVGSALPAVTSPDEVETPVEAVGIHHTRTCKCLQGGQACAAVHTTQLHTHASSMKKLLLFHCSPVIDPDVDEGGHQAGCTASLGSAAIGFLPPLSTAPP